MSAAVVTTEQVISDEDGLFKVRLTGTSVQVTWPCGTERSFSETDLVQAIADVDAIRKLPDLPDDTFLRMKDSTGRRYSVAIRGDRITADVDDNSAGDAVDWKALKAAIKVVAKGLPA